MSDDYRPREHDHLVEPMFGGLRGAGERGQGEPRRGWLARLWAWLRARFTAREP